MGKKYYGGIGTDEGFVMHSPESEHFNDFDDSASSTSGARNANRNASHIDADDPYNSLDDE